MERTKWKEILAPIVSDFLRVGMWPIISRIKDSETGIVRKIYKYGSGLNAGKIIVNGELCEQDRGAFLIIRAMDKNNGYEGVTGKIPDLVKMKGVKRSDSPSSVNPMWDSVEKLLDVTVRIKPNHRGGSLSVAFKLVTGYLDSDGSFFLITHDYQKTIEKLGLYEYKIPLPEYFNSKSAITRSLREFLRTQSLPNTGRGRGYEISLLKLCKYIGYNRENKPYWEVWRQIKRSINELKTEMILSGKSDRDENRNKEEGGIIMFWKVNKHAKKEQPSGNSIVNDPLIELLHKTFAENKIKTDDNSFRSAFNKLTLWIKKTTYNSSLKYFIERYIGWLEDQDKVEYITANLFVPDNSFFKAFELLRREDGDFDLPKVNDMNQYDDEDEDDEDEDEDEYGEVIRTKKVQKKKKNKPMQRTKEHIIKNDTDECPVNDFGSHGQHVECDKCDNKSYCEFVTNLE